MGDLGKLRTAAGREGRDLARSATRAGAPRDARRAGGLAWLRGVPLWAASLPLMLFFVVPLLALVLRITPGELLASLADPQAAQAIGLSLRTTLATVAMTLLAGTPAAYLLARKHFRGRTLVDTLLDLPMVLPPAVAGIALLVAFGRQGLVGGWLSGVGVSLPFTEAAVVLAQLFVAAPFYVRTAVVAFAGIERELEQAAAVDGASRLAIFRRITLPLAAPALLGGAVMTWARALGEFGATILFAGNLPGRTQTMPLAIYLGFEAEGLRVALALAVILLAVSFGVLLLVKGVLHRRVAIVQ